MLDKLLLGLTIVLLVGWSGKMTAQAQIAEAVPGDEEHVLGHLGRRVAVAHDPPGDVVDGVEPPVEQPAERPLVPVPGGEDEGGVGLTDPLAAPVGPDRPVLTTGIHRPASQHVPPVLTRPRPACPG